MIYLSDLNINGIDLGDRVGARAFLGDILVWSSSPIDALGYFRYYDGNIPSEFVDTDITSGEFDQYLVYSLGNANIINEFGVYTEAVPNLSGETNNYDHLNISTEFIDPSQPILAIYDRLLGYGSANIASEFINN